MIINVVDWKDRIRRIEVQGEIQNKTNKLSEDYYYCAGKRWIKSKQKFSSVVLGNSFKSYEVE